jgi:DNA-directed RNA polymerase I, II, and III subunit RPABC2
MTDNTEYVLTKYERARIIGIRAIQLSNGAIPMINVTNINNVSEIAEQELIEYKIPLIIRRKMPDGTNIDIRVCDMILE